MAVDGTELVDLTILVKLPATLPDASKPPDWPGPLLLERLAEVATGLPISMLELAYPAEVAQLTGTRTVDKATEIAISVANWEP